MCSPPSHGCCHLRSPLHMAEKSSAQASRPKRRGSSWANDASGSWPHWSRRRYNDFARRNGSGTAGTQRGIVRWAHRDDERRAAASPPRSSKTHIGSVDPDALKIPARRAEYSLTESALSPFHAEPAHISAARRRITAAPIGLVGSRLTTRALQRGFTSRRSGWNAARR